MIQVTGTVVNAIGMSVPNSLIRVTPIVTGSKVVQAEATIATGSDALYDFSLDDGEYMIEMLFPKGNNNDEFVEVGIVTLLGTSGSVSLNELLTTYAS